MLQRLLRVVNIDVMSRLCPQQAKDPSQSRAVHTRHARLQSAHDSSPCTAQVYNPYGRPYTLPIPADAKPSAVTTAPDLNYPQASDGGLLALAGAGSEFALRFSGEQRMQDLLNCRYPSDSRRPDSSRAES